MLGAPVIAVVALTPEQLLRLRVEGGASQSGELGGGGGRI